MASYRPVQSADQVLRVLCALNRYPIAKVKDLARDTGLPAATVVRLLETLVAQGYARKLDRLSGYCVGAGVLELTAGYHGLPTIFDGAKAVAEGLTRDFL